jgi:RNA ligase (TIGR02306 family)
MFKDNEINRTKNLYVRTAIDLDLPRKVRELGEQLQQSVDLFGEIYGAGVQDLHYGTTKPEFRAFDLMLDGKFADADTKARLFDVLGVQRVPVLYRGPFDRAVLEGHRDGTTLVNRKMDANAGACIREGIVVTATGDQTKRETADGRHRLRPILKMVSPDYLTRKGDDATEFE